MVPGQNFRDPYAALFARVAREVAITVPSLGAAADVVAASDLVTMLPVTFLAVKAAALGLRALAAPLLVHRIVIAMCWHERTRADPAARALRTFVRRVVTSSLSSSAS